MSMVMRGLVMYFIFSLFVKVKPAPDAKNPSTGVVQAPYRNLLLNEQELVRRPPPPPEHDPH